MIVFKPAPEDYAQSILPAPADSDRLMAAEGVRQLPHWVPARVELLKRDSGRFLKAVDMPFALESFALNARAKDALADVVGNDAELLPLACEDEELWLLNPLHVSNALDEKRSELVRFPSSGRIADIVRPVFDRRKLGDHRFFLLRQPRWLYVTQAVVEAVREAKLTGVIFTPVWSDEAS